MRRFSRYILLLVVALAVISAGSCFAKQQSAIQKQTFQAPMRDGVKLATDVYLPKSKGRFPVIFMRTPYNKNSNAAMGAGIASVGYACVVQDTRGRGESQGENLPFFGDLFGEHQDGYDSLEWIAKQPWCNGKIGTIGGSAVGITQLGMAGSGTKRLTTQHISVAAPDLYRDIVFPGGVFKKAMVEDWLRDTKHSPDSVSYWAKNPDYNDFWRTRDITSRYGKVDVPAIHIGGWYDLFTQGTLDTFNGYQTKGGPKARGHQKLIMGPWTHGIFQPKAGELSYPNGQAPPDNIQDPIRWFNYYLKGMDNGIGSVATVTYYVMGDASDPTAPGNLWRTAAVWPPFETRPTPYYFRADNVLSTQKPKGDAPLVYAYDPANPVPTVGGPQLSIPAGPMDQRKIEGRSDVLVFSTTALADSLEVTGWVHVELWASSDAPDTDFMAKLCDVYPDGRSMNVCEGLLRARFRDGFEKEKLMKPGEIYRFDIDLWSTSIVFNKGHRLRVQITSSSFPGYDPNPNTGEPFRASTRTRIAHNTIYIDARRPSQIVLPVPVSPKP